MKPVTSTLNYLIAIILSFSGDFRNDSVENPQFSDTTQTFTLSKVENAWLTDNHSHLYKNELFNFLGGINLFIFLLYIGPLSLIIGVSIRNRNLKDRNQQINSKEVLQTPDSKSKSAGCGKLPSYANQNVRQLTCYSLAIIQKQNLLAQVKGEIIDLIRLPNSPVLQDPSIGKKFDSLLEDADADQRNYWDDFLSSFQMLYPNYFLNIRSKVADISDKELKLAALLRLGLDTKKIAALLSLSPESVKVFRHRLRKKMELNEDANLYNSLCHFDEKA